MKVADLPPGWRLQQHRWRHLNPGDDAVVHGDLLHPVPAPKPTHVDPDSLWTIPEHAAIDDAMHLCRAVLGPCTVIGREVTT